MFYESTGPDHPLDAHVRVSQIRVPVFLSRTGGSGYYIHFEKRDLPEGVQLALKEAAPRSCLRTYAGMINTLLHALERTGLEANPEFYEMAAPPCLRLSDEEIFLTERILRMYSASRERARQ